MYELHNQQHPKKYRKDLRKKQIKAERKLWQWLRRSQLGYKFRRQQGINNFIVDFYCAPLKLIIEVDGYIHGDEEKKKSDKKRENKLRELGFHILRIRNEQILFEEEDAILTIVKECDRLNSLRNPL